MKLTAGSSSSSLTSRANSHHTLEYPTKTCAHGLPSPAIPSGTPKNFSRMFYGCPLYPSKDMCNYFEWADPEVCPYGLRALKRFNSKCVKLNDEISDLIGLNHQLLEDVKGLDRVNLALKEEIKVLHHRERLIIWFALGIVLVMLAVLLRSAVV